MTTRLQSFHSRASERRIGVPHIHSFFRHSRQSRSSPLCRLLLSVISHNIAHIARYLLSSSSSVDRQYPHGSRDDTTLIDFLSPSIPSCPNTEDPPPSCRYSTSNPPGFHLNRLILLFSLILILDYQLRSTASDLAYLSLTAATKTIMVDTDNYTNDIWRALWGYQLFRQPGE